MTPGAWELQRPRVLPRPCGLPSLQVGSTAQADWVPQVPQSSTTGLQQARGRRRVVRPPAPRANSTPGGPDEEPEAKRAAGRGRAAAWGQATYCLTVAAPPVVSGPASPERKPNPVLPLLFLSILGVCAIVPWLAKKYAWTFLQDEEGAPPSPHGGHAAAEAGTGSEEDWKQPPQSKHELKVQARSGPGAGTAPAPEAAPAVAAVAAATAAAAPIRPHQRLGPALTKREKIALERQYRMRESAERLEHGRKGAAAFAAQGPLGPKGEAFLWAEQKQRERLGPAPGPALQRTGTVVLERDESALSSSASRVALERSDTVKFEEPPVGASARTARRQLAGPVGPVAEAAPGEEEASQGNIVTLGSGAERGAKKKGTGAVEAARAA